MIEFKNVSKQYDNGTEALNNVNFKIAKGEFVFLIGASGAGKSSILKIITKEEEPTKGTVLINEKYIKNIKKREIPYYRRKLGMVFQDFRLLNDKTVYNNVAYALEIVETPKHEIKKRVNLALAMVGLSRKYKSYPSELSGGEQQRVAIARALVNKPAILIADEPTGNLDPATSEEIMDLLRQVNKMGTTVLVSTHAETIVNSMRKRVIEIENGVIVRDEQKGHYNNESEDI